MNKQRSDKKKKNADVFESIRAYLNKIWHGIASDLSKISVEKNDIYRALISLGLVLFFALAETTFFSRFRPFGASPDLMIPLVMALAMKEGATWGGAFGIVAGVIIDSIGATGMTLDPLLFCLIGFFTGLFLEEYFSDMLAVRALIIGVGAFLRAILSLIFAAQALPQFVLADVLGKMIIPELGATLVLSPLPHLAAFLSLKWAHKTRAERMDK